ncbi:mitochondrial carrier protein [Pseudohyphozyma bogoriensis]|nr:mitochondrial carrier protein [Pseudohyphozyma bogoriensis]
MSTEARINLPALLPPTATPPPAAAAPKYVFAFSRNSSLPLFPRPNKSAFIAGALAGAASRTVVSPLERLKILLQIQGKNGEYRGIYQSLAKMWREEGFRGYMRGNGINVLRIAPYSAVQFSSYELFKGILASNGAEIDTPRRLIAGSLAGICSVVSTYPLDLVRSRLSIESAQLGGVDLRPQDGRKATGIITMTIKVFREEGGFRGLYRGLTPTAAGVAIYEILKKSFSTENHHPGAFSNLLCGALAGSVSQTLTYPLDVLRRRMQVAGMASMGLGYTSTWDCVKKMIKSDGPFALYKDKMEKEKAALKRVV